jgi:hypothetical protein
MNILTICFLPLKNHEILYSDITLNWRRINGAIAGKEAIPQRSFVQWKVKERLNRSYPQYG